jgi:hypothetical protein
MNLFLMQNSLSEREPNLIVGGYFVWLTRLLEIRVLPLMEIYVPWASSEMVSVSFLGS